MLDDEVNVDGHVPRNDLIRHERDHAPERIRGKPGVDFCIRQSLFLVLPGATLDGMRKRILMADPRLPNFFIERGDLLDNPQNCGIVPIRLEIVAIGGPDAVDRLRIFGYRINS